MIINYLDESWYGLSDLEDDEVDEYIKQWLKEKGVRV